MSEQYELLEHAENGNYYPQGKFVSAEEAHKHAKSLAFEPHEYTVQKSHDPYYASSKKNIGGKE